jgi:hypothetical protein
MGLTRRTFLQRVGLALTSLGLSDVGLSLLADRYQQALAQPTRRKLALLIGINQYPEQVCDFVATRGSALNGCLTDVALQQELLVHRFGFQPNDILTLIEQQATREAIATAFQTHLIEQARSGDVVVVHFSGLGSQVRVADQADRVQNSIVPIDGLLPTADDPTIHDLLEETLGLLVRSLPTQHVTTVLDLSYLNSDQVQGNWRIRSRPSTPSGTLSTAEKQLQDQLLGKLKPLNRNRNGDVSQWPGIVLAAAESNQVAIEGQWRGFSAGLLTYALTQQLWHTTSPTTLRFSLAQTAATVKHWVGQRQSPQLLGQATQTNRELAPAYFLNPDGLADADGVITAVEDDGKTARIWLGGLPAAVLDYVGPNSLLRLVSSIQANPELASSTDLLLQLRSREGLLGRARWADPTVTVPITPGQQVQEVTRLIPRHLNLVVALDQSLERIERVDATSAFAAVPRVSAVAAGEQPADYLFGKTTTAQTLAALSSTTIAETISPGSSPTPKGSYGLFNLGRAAIPYTLIDGDEAVKTAVNRLSPKLRTLLAAKLLYLTVNSASSQLGVQVTLDMVAPEAQVILQQETPRAPWSLPERQQLTKSLNKSVIPTVPIGSQLRYRVQNYSDRPLYFALLGFDSSGNAIALYVKSPTSVDSTNIAEPWTEDGAIAPGTTVTLPPMSTSAWVANGPGGLVETYLIFSRNPLVHSLSAIEAQITPRSNGRLTTLSDPLEIVHAVLEDLHSSASEIATPVDSSFSESYRLDVATWATLNFSYQVTPA